MIVEYNDANNGNDTYCHPVHTVESRFFELLRWPNTVFARALADAI